MAFATQSTNKEDIKQSGSSYISGSGFYPVNILAPFVDTNASDSSVVNFFVEHKGQQQVIYGNLRVTNNGGLENKFGMKVFNQLLVIAEVQEVTDPVEADLPIGKGASEKTVAVLEDLADQEVMMRIQMEYSVFDHKIKEKKIIKAFYRAGDNATAEEIVNDNNHGDSYKKDLDSANRVTYKNDLTEEDIKLWVTGGRKGGVPRAVTESKEPSFGAAKPFGAKKTFGKK
jgi:hypothetical protein